MSKSPPYCRPPVRWQLSSVYIVFYVILFFVFSAGKNFCVSQNHPTIPYPIASRDSALTFTNLKASDFQDSVFIQKVIFINGELTVDKNLFFENCTLYMGTGSRIVIPSVVSGITLSIHCSFVTSCKEMWDGIYIYNKDNRLLMSSVSQGTCGNITIPSVVSHAINAVVSENGGYFNLRNYYFLDNLVGVDIRQYTATAHQGSVSGCFFSAPALIAPLAGVRGETGIEINNVADVTIGTTGTNNKNTFSNLYHGIKATGSNVTSTNNLFQNLTFDAPNEINAYGIHSTGSNTSNPASITAVTANTFSNCDYGIFTKLRQNVTIKGCTLTNATNAIHVETNIGKTVTIQNNLMNNFQSGILCLLVGSSTINITNNKLFQNGTLNIFSNARGIVVRNAMVPKPSTTIIENNTITGTPGIVTGIECIFVSTLKIKSNNITITKDNAAVAAAPVNLYGIRAMQCTDAFIYNNTVQRSAANVPNITVSERLFGISIENSPGVLLGNNAVQNMGGGIYASGSCPLSKIYCNKLLQCYDGVFLENANIGDQGSQNLATANTWSDPLNSSIPPGRRIRYKIPNIIAWYHSNAPSSNNPQSGAGAFNDGNFPITFTLANGISACGVIAIPIGPSPGAAREQQFGSVVRNENQFAVNPFEFKMAEKEFAFRGLKEENLLQLGMADDAMYQQFYDSVANVNIGKLNEVRIAIEQGDLLLAESKNNTLVTSHIIEENRKQFNDVYLQTWAKGNKNVSTGQQSTLEAIACQYPFMGGEAVYSARVMLRMNNGCNTSAQKQPSKLINKLAEESLEDKDNLSGGLWIPFEQTTLNTGNIYPNPNNGNMMFNYLLQKGNTGNLIITDIQGRVVGNYTLSHLKTSLQIDKTNLDNGVYFYSLHINDEAVFHKRLIVIK